MSKNGKDETRIYSQNLDESKIFPHFPNSILQSIPTHVNADETLDYDLQRTDDNKRCCEFSGSGSIGGNT